MTSWDLRTLLRAFAAALLGIAVVWLVTAASDEGHLTIGVRAGRTLPVAPLCSAVGAALALGTTRVREEVRALEALGRSPAETARTAALGAALPSILVAIAIASSAAIDVSGFYPRPPRGETFVFADGVFTSPSLGVSIDAEGAPKPLATASAGATSDEGLPAGARVAASLATGSAGIALALVAARSTLRTSMLDRRQRRRRRAVALAEVLTCVLVTLVAFQAAAARLAPAALATVPPIALLAVALWAYRPSVGRTT